MFLLWLKAGGLSVGGDMVRESEGQRVLLLVLLWEWECEFVFEEECECLEWSLCRLWLERASGSVG